MNPLSLALYLSLLPGSYSISVDLSYILILYELPTYPNYFIRYLGSLDREGSKWGAWVPLHLSKYVF